MAAKVRLSETNETGEQVALYIASGGDGDQHGRCQDESPPPPPPQQQQQRGQRIDIIKPPHTTGKSAWTWLMGVFLPVGYPHSVTEDYMWYQIFDSLQAFTSSIAGLLSSRAVLQGVGVGDASASPTAALLLSVLQDSTGRIATILFAHRLGTSLEPECKMYRLAADVFNDTAMVLDCLSPAFPRAARVTILSASSVLRALCGVAAGSSKASLSAHFAKWGNLGELNAKDSSQETVISLLGMLAGSVVVAYVSSPLATWTCLLVLLTLHLATNYAAVKAVKLCTLNRQRANLAFAHYKTHGSVPSPEVVAERERIFESDGILRWEEWIIATANKPSPSKPSQRLGWARIGVSLQELLRSTQSLQPPPPQASIAPSLPRETGTAQSKVSSTTPTGPEAGTTASGAVLGRTTLLASLLDTFAGEEYILWHNARQRQISIVLKPDAQPGDHLKAWSHALWLAKCARDIPATKDGKEQSKKKHSAKGGARGPQDEEEPALDLLRRTRDDIKGMWSMYMQLLEQAGWDTRVMGIETTSSARRVRVES